MITIKNKSIRGSIRNYDVILDINDKEVNIEVIVEDNNIVGLEYNYNFINGSSKLTEEEKDGIYEFIINNF